MTVRVVAGGREGEQPVADTWVAVDTANERVEGKTDARGVAELTVPDAPLVDVVAFKAGRRVAMVSGSFAERAIERDSELVLEAPDIEVGETVTLEGTANLGATTDALIVTTSLGAAHEALGPRWSIDVPPDAPFRLYALSYAFDTSGLSERGRGLPAVGGRVLDVDPVGTGTTTVDIDLVNTPPLAAAAGVFPAPEDTVFEASGRGFVNVVTVTDGALAYIGTPAKVDLVEGDGGRWFYTVDYIPVEDEPVWTFFRFFGEDGTLSFALLPGVQEGDVDVDFELPPRMIVPERGDVPHPITEPIRWELEEGVDAEAVVMVIANSDGTHGVWKGTSNDQQMTMPPLPTGVPHSDHFPFDVRAQLYTCTTSPELAPRCARGADARRFTIAP